MSTRPASERQTVGPGIFVDAIGLKSCTFQDRLFDSVFHGAETSAATDGSEEEDRVDLRAQVNVFFREDGNAAVVELEIQAFPRAQPTWSCAVAMFGQFSAGDSAAMPLSQFVWSNGIAYLVPFVRERLASLTGASMYSPYFLPPLSVPSILKLAGVTPADPEKAEAVSRSKPKEKKSTKKHPV